MFLNDRNVVFCFLFVRLLSRQHLVFCSVSLHAESVREARGKISANESFGFVSGAILGGLSGGPPGVLLGAGFGAILGDRWTSNKYALDNMRAALNKSNLELTLAKNELATIDQRYNSLNSQQDVKKLSYSKDSELNFSCCESKFSIHFKTTATMQFILNSLANKIDATLRL